MMPNYIDCHQLVKEWKGDSNVEHLTRGEVGFLVGVLHNLLPVID